MSEVPPQTREQRVAAGQAAVRARQVRAAAKKRVADGVASVAQIIAEADSDPALARMPVIELLQSMYGMGQVRAAAVMDTLGIAQSRRVGGLGSHQRAALEERYATCRKRTGSQS